MLEQMNGKCQITARLGSPANPLNETFRQGQWGAWLLGWAGAGGDGTSTSLAIAWE